MRVGNERGACTSSQLSGLIFKGSNLTFDAVPTKLSKDDVSFTYLRGIYKSKTGKEFQESDFISFGLTDQNNFLTNAGQLLADTRYIYCSRIFATRWSGLTKGYSKLEVLDDKEFDEGGLLCQLDGAKDFIQRNSKKIWKKEGDHRVEFPDYPERAVTEAIVNAIIHRDYRIGTTEIHIDMYDDRLEINSPGGMCDGTLIQDQELTNISSKRRNPIIADVFGRMNLMERRGIGLKKILEAYETQKNYDESLKPSFKSTATDFIIVLKNLNYKKSGELISNDIDLNTKQEFNQSIKKAIFTKQEFIVVQFAKDTEFFKTKDIEALLNVSYARAYQILSKLTKNNILESIGANKNRQYKFKSEWMSY